MNIYVNHKPAVLKQGTSFEYISENRLFSDADDYTLSITFPLRGCQANLEIFGHINRADVVADKVIFDCEIIDRNLHKSGSIVVTEINEVEVKTQFLEGRSEGNFTSTLDKVYINELHLGTATLIPALSPATLWSQENKAPGAVPLPWVNDSTGILQNEVVFNSGAWRWATGVKSLSRQPYLIYLARLICQAVGYQFDFSEWNTHAGYRHLLVCNTLPVAWELTDYAAALPHWSVEEFFAKLELLLDGEFDFNHRARKVTFSFSQARIEVLPPVALDTVTEEHSMEVSIDDVRCEYRDAKNIAFKECSYSGWTYLSCDWFIKQMKVNIERYPDLDTLITANIRFKEGITDSIKLWEGGIKVLHAQAENAYFILQLYRWVPHIDGGPADSRWEFKSRLRPINLFGGSLPDLGVSDDYLAPTQEIDFVPVRIDSTDDRGPVIFLSPSAFQESGTQDPDAPIDETPVIAALKKGEKTQTTEYYDRIYLGWWDGSYVYEGKQPAPYPDDIILFDDWSYVKRKCALPLRSRICRNVQIDPRRKRTFKFLADSIPDVRAIFFIKGKRYVCEKITATFTENGMSQLLKGSFYPVVD